MSNLNNENKLISMILASPRIIEDKEINVDIIHNQKNKNIFNAVKELIEGDNFVSKDILISKMPGIKDYLTFMYEQNIDMRELEAVYSIQKNNSLSYKVSKAMNEMNKVINSDMSAEDKEAMLTPIFEDIQNQGAGDDSGLFTFSKGIQNYINELDVEINRVYTGFDLLDEHVAGMYDVGEVSCIFGVSGSGKTTLLQNLMTESAYRGTKSCFVSLEMSEKQIINRFMSAESGVSIKKIKTKDLSVSDLNKIQNIDEEKLKAFSENTIFYDRSCAVEQLRGIIRNSRRKLNGLDVVFIDYIQILSTFKNKTNRVEEIESVVMQLKSIAKDMGVAVVMLGQVNREATKSANKRPEMIHLKGSSAIDNVCSIMISVHREEAWNDAPDMPLKGYAEIYIKKNRHGETNKMIIAKTDLEHSKFIDIKSRDEQVRLSKIVHDYISKLK